MSIFEVIKNDGKIRFSGSEYKRRSKEKMKKKRKLLKYLKKNYFLCHLKSATLLGFERPWKNFYNAYKYQYTVYSRKQGTL